MHRLGRTILVLSVLTPTCSVHSQWTSPYAYDPALHFLAMPLDPWTYSSAAGPAGGWGITATPSNPASLAFGPAFSAALTYLDDSESSDDIKSMSAGAPLPSNLRFGLVASWQPGRRTVSWDHYSYPYAFINGVWRSQYSWQATLSYRVSAALALGASVRHTRSSSIVEWTLAWDVHRRDFAESTDWTLDLGVRMSGLLEKLTWGSVGNSGAPPDQQLWTPGVTAGLSLQNVRIAANTSGLDSVPRAPMPRRIEAGLSWVVLAMDRSALTLNSTYITWINDQRSGRVFTRDVLLDFGRWGVGAAVDLGGIVGGGVSYWSGYQDGVDEFSWFLSFGIRVFHVMVSKGFEMRSSDGYKFEYESGKREPEYADRIYLRALIPVGYTSKPKPKTVREEPEDWRSVP